ncbi:MAG TPA: hypothetical protein VGR95_21435 [Thermoanaerobaculia bacterium]|jgi:hypothetical protein|nr:hypothetical protein [Thermoanaerobaculia bacterium]
MPVTKYRSIEEMNRDWRWNKAGDPAITRKVRQLWRMAERAVQPVGLCIPRGIRKYRSIEEANGDRDKWERERIDRLRKARGLKKS